MKHIFDKSIEAAPSHEKGLYGEEKDETALLE